MFDSKKVENFFKKTKRVNKEKSKNKEKIEDRASISNELKIELNPDSVSKSMPSSKITIKIDRSAFGKLNDKDRSVELKQNKATFMRIRTQYIVPANSEICSSPEDSGKTLNPAELVRDGDIQSLKNFFAFKSEKIEPVNFIQSKKFGARGRSLLHIAVLENHIEIIEYFYKLGVDLMKVAFDENDETPWHYLAKKFDKKMFLTLILFKNSFETIELKNKKAETPYEYATRYIAEFEEEAKLEKYATLECVKECAAEYLAMCDQKQFIRAIKDAYIDAHIYNDEMDYLLQIETKKSKRDKEYKRSESNESLVNLNLNLNLTDVKKLIKIYKNESEGEILPKPSSKTSPW